MESPLCDVVGFESRKNIGMVCNTTTHLMLKWPARRPANWKLRAQAPFGQIVAPAGDGHPNRRSFQSFLATNNHFNLVSETW